MTNISADYLNSIVTLAVGLLALVVYWLTKMHEKRNAATVIVMDIRHAEQVVLTILEKGAVDKTLKNILTENNWNKYKHLFASNFSHDDFSAFNRFFSSCVEMSDARVRMIEVFYAGLYAKAEIAQQKIFEIDNLHTPEGQDKKRKLIMDMHNEDALFEPGEPIHRVFRSLQLMGRLSNTVAFEKLKRIAKMRI